MFVQEHKRFSIHLDPGDAATLYNIIDFCENMPDCTEDCPMHYWCRTRFKENQYLYEIIQDLIDIAKEEK